jgi:hypothetical protein
MPFVPAGAKVLSVIDYLLADIPRIPFRTGQRLG